MCFGVLNLVFFVFLCFDYDDLLYVIAITSAMSRILIVESWFRHPTPTQKGGFGRISLRIKIALYYEQMKTK